MKERFILGFPPECSDRPITYHLIKDYRFKVNILRAEITPGKEGRLLIEAEADIKDFKRGMDFLRGERVRVYPLMRKINIDLKRCIHCGICTAVCISSALAMERRNWKITFNVTQCVGCELCIKACPLRLIQLNFLNNLNG